jgi:hypothetical protein
MEFTQAERDEELYSHEHTVLAVLSNEPMAPPKPDFTINLKKVDISEKEFLQLFFNHSTNYFHVNSSNKFSKLISLKDQIYISNSNQLIHFNFVQILMSKMAEKESVSARAFETLSKLTVIKNATKIQSLAQLRGYQQALTWFETIDFLISSNIIVASSNPLAVANALLRIQFVFFDTATNLSLAINYNYNVAIPGHTNVNKTESTPFTYSLDETYKKKAPVKEDIAPTSKPIAKFDAEDGDGADNGTYVQSNNDNDDESLGYSITNSIMQQIKLVQQDSSSDGDSVSLNDDADTWV